MKSRNASRVLSEKFVKKFQKIGKFLDILDSQNFLSEVLLLLKMKETMLACNRCTNSFEIKATTCWKILQYFTHPVEKLSQRFVNCHGVKSCFHEVAKYQQLSQSFCLLFWDQTTIFVDISGASLHIAKLRASLV